MIALLALLSANPAQAADGYWHPNDLMAESKAFKRLNGGMVGPFEERTRQSDEYARALNDYQLALDLLGSRARQEDRAHLDGLRRQFNRDQAVIEAFASALIEDVDTTFYAAVERALGSMEGEFVACEREVASGPQVPGMRPRTKANPECTGDDVNARVASSLDTDATLAAEIDEILGLEWPSFALETGPRPPSGEGARWVAVHALFSKGARDALKRIDLADENARLPFQAAIEGGASKEELARLKKEAEGIAAQTAGRRASLGAPVFEAAEKSLAKSGTPLAWCPTPATLGGCDGEDASASAIPELLDDDRVEKALKKASAAVGG